MASCQQAIDEFAAECKEERDRAVTEAIATERKYYEPEIARLESLAAQWEQETQKTKNDKLFNLLIGIGGGAVAVLLITAL